MSDPLESVISVSVVVFSPHDADAQELLDTVQSVEQQDYPKDAFDVLVVLDQHQLGEAVGRRLGVTQANTLWVTFVRAGEPMKHPGELRQLMNNRFLGRDVPVWTTEEWLDEHLEEGL